MSPAREALSRCLVRLAELRSEIDAQLSAAEAASVDAVAAYEARDHARAMALLDKACDLEFEALLDCDATGTLKESIYPETNDAAAGEAAADSEIVYSLREGDRE